MKIKHNSIFFFCFFSMYFLTAMDQSITVIHGGKSIAYKKQDLEKFRFFKNSRRFHQVSGRANSTVNMDNFLISPQALELVFAVGKDEKNAQKIVAKKSLETIREGLELVHFLGAKQDLEDVFKSVYARKIEDAVNQEGLESHKECLQYYMDPFNNPMPYLPSFLIKLQRRGYDVSKLYKNGQLNLSGLGIKRLDGLCQLDTTIPLDNIQELDISNNTIRTLNLPQQLNRSCFKGIKKIVADNSGIQELPTKTIFCLPKSSCLSLVDNPLQEIGKKTLFERCFKEIPSGCTIVVSNVDSKVIEDLHSLMAPSYARQNLRLVGTLVGVPLAFASMLTSPFLALRLLTRDPDMSDLVTMVFGITGAAGFLGTTDLLIRDKNLRSSIFEKSTSGIIIHNDSKS